MKIIFNIDYRTNWGESLYLVGNLKELGDNIEDNAIKLEFNGIRSWTLPVELSGNLTEITYRYFVKHENGNIKKEWGNPHKFIISGKVSLCEIYDSWQDMPHDKPFYSSAFIDGISSRTKAKEYIGGAPGNIIISVSAPLVKSDEYIAISGDSELLGNWDVTKAIPMNDHDFPDWSISLDIKKIKLPFGYKFLTLKKKTNEIVSWENCENRIFNITPAKKTSLVILSGLKYNYDRLWKGAGIAIPVFSIRSEEDFGVGDFYDLFKIIDWTVVTGQKFVQILPINDTTMTHTWTDSYPYNANSTFALHPMYLRLNAIGTLSDKTRQKYFDDLGKELNALPEIDYERVTKAKNEYLKELYSEIGEKVKKEKAYKVFVENNSYWLGDYAAFCILRDIHNTPDFSEWGKYSVYNENMITEFGKEHKDEIEFIFFVQYYLDKQMRDVRNYAHKKGVVIKGDIPIGISRTSADAWVNPKLFHMDCQAGAPPDDFSVLGQNWGFPTYNWEEMNKDGFKWWKDRFKKMSEYFDAYRIDHILGFFRIWQIPMDAVHGLLGTFNPALPYSYDELKYNYDFWLDKDLQATPFIMEYFLFDFFGEYIEEAKKEFLIDKGHGRYGFEDFVNSQKKVMDYFSDKDDNEKNSRIKNALLGLHDEVLFIEDSKDKGKYHPRISAQYTYVYRSLSDYERWCYDRLYNDFFYHRHNDFWYGKAMWKLPPLIDSTDMLVCGEDLGMIPACVPAVMNDLKILSLEIQRMPKNPRLEFGNTHAYPYMSVCTTSTHDMGGIRAWWEEDREKTQHFYNNVMHEDGLAPYYAEPWICDRIISLHLDSPSMLTILPLQDWLSIHGTIRRDNPQDEQINVPANSRHYWKYRMHIPIENLLKERDFNKYLKEKIAYSGR